MAAKVTTGGRRNRRVGLRRAVREHPKGKTAGRRQARPRRTCDRGRADALSGRYSHASTHDLDDLLDEPFFTRLYQALHDLPRANGHALATGACTVIAGLVLRRFWRRYALVAAVVVGALFGNLLNLLVGPANSGLELLGVLSLSAIPLSLPSFDLESMYVLRELLTSAFSIAFLGLMQTIVIARSLGARSGQQIDTNQEITAQGLSNLVAPFFSSFAGSGSFNRSGANYDVGARTPMAGVFSSVLLAAIVLAGSGLIAYLPMAVVAGALVLVGYGLIDLAEIRRVLRSRHETVVYGLTLLGALTFGLNAGVFAGLLISLAIYMWYAATPNIHVEEYLARNGSLVRRISIDSNLFFGSVRHVEKRLAELEARDSEAVILLISTDHLTYLDVPGALLLGNEIRRQRDRGGDGYIYVTRPSIGDLLQKAGVMQTCGEACLIERNVEHPMKEILVA